MAMTDLEIIYEDNHLIVINKPNGLLVHTDETGDPSLEEILREYVREKYQKPTLYRKEGGQNLSGPCFASAGTT